jgi:membrane-associated protease RseP (regulator of RpoE activity)
MSWTTWKLIAVLACLLLAVPRAADGQEFKIRVVGDGEQPARVTAELPDYWIGVALRETDPSLLAHLKLEFGVMVGQVIDGSPAAKVGLMPLDIITHAGDKEIKTGEDLLKAVGEAKDKELTLTIYREAKKESINVTPAKRPEDQLAPEPPRAVETQPREAVERALRLWKDRAGPLELDLLGPGIVVRAEPAPIPDDMTITVERQGPKAAKITVKQGENSWGGNEKEIDTLPEVARPHVRMMLGQATDHLFAFGETAKLPKVATPVEPPRVRRQELRIERDEPLKRIEQELKQLRKEVEELRKRDENK